MFFSSPLIAEVKLLDGDRAHIAMTGSTPGHVEIWAPVDILVERAVVVSDH
jgi:hypothetical protein